MAQSPKLTEAVSHWQAAEQRLYPVVMTRPDLYEQSVLLVRAVADELKSAHSLEMLLETYERAGEVVAEVIRKRELSTQEIDLGLITGAAFSLRYRELLEQMHRDEAIQRIRRGRERGEAWIVIYETGFSRGEARPPYRRLEMHLADGTGLHVFIELDPETARPVYGVEAVQLDPQTGDWLHQMDPLSERQTFAEPAPWGAAIEALHVQFTGAVE